jgi:single-strand selective monofunctional uracil DNA glycosylase
MDRVRALKNATQALKRAVDQMAFEEPVTHVYNPLGYAKAPHDRYIERFGRSRKKVVFLGMNPGPWGMAQTGVPFGQVESVRDFLGIEEEGRKPRDEHPKRPILGFDCTRSEVSGARLWGGVSQHFGSADLFFKHHYIANYCPLIFLEEGGRNRTPDKLKKEERDRLHEICDRHLVKVVDALQPEWVIGIGKFAEKRARLALPERGLKFAAVLHPSPANPHANRGWLPEVTRQIKALGLCESDGGSF